MTEYHYRCWAEIDRGAVRHNAALIKKRLGPNVEILAVVKADAYGHGMIPVAQALSKDADLFGVANLVEAITLRAAVRQPITLLGPALPQEFGSIAEHGFIPSISSWEEADQFNRLASNNKVLINFKIDTGMGRMGVPAHQAMALFKKVKALPRVEIHSVSTHLPVSNEDEVFTRDQLRGFSALVKQLRSEAPGNYKAHALQTAGALEFADEPFDIVRPGMLFFGISPLPQFQTLEAHLPGVDRSRRGRRQRPSARSSALDASAWRRRGSRWRRARREAASRRVSRSDRRLGRHRTADLGSRPSAASLGQGDRQTIQGARAQSRGRSGGIRGRKLAAADR